MSHLFGEKALNLPKTVSVAFYVITLSSIFQDFL